MADDHIKINDVSPRVQFSANGVDVAFQFLFPAFDATDIEVYINDTLQTVDVTVVLSTPPTAGGTVTFITAPSASAVVTIIRKIPIDRTTDFQDSGEFRAQVINDELDTIVAVQQQLQDSIDRSIGLADSDPDASMVLPLKDDRANKILGFNANGEPIVSDDTLTEIQGAADSAAAAAVSEANAAVSESNAAASETGAAASATAAATSATSNLFSTILNKSNSDSPIAPTASDDGTIFVIDTSGGSVDVNLPSIAAVGEGYRIGVVNDSGANSIAVNRNGADTINGLIFRNLTEDTEQVTFVADDNTQDNWVGFGGSSIIGAGSITTVMLADGAVTPVKLSSVAKRQVIAIALGDEETEIEASTNTVTFRVPYAFTLTDVRASLTTAQTSGAVLTVDVNEGGTSILSTKITFDNTEKTSTTAATASVISDSVLADDAEITVDVDQVGDGTATGLKLYLIGYPA